MRVLSLIATWCSALLMILLGGLPAASAERASIGSRAERVGASGYAEADAGVLSLGQCPSGHFCVWGLPNYTQLHRVVQGGDGRERDPPPWWACWIVLEQPITGVRPVHEHGRFFYLLLRRREEGQCHGLVRSRAEGVPGTRELRRVARHSLGAATRAAVREGVGVNDEEFTAFFATMHPALLRYGMRKLDVDTASEVALDALRVVWEKNIPAPQSDDEHRKLTGLTYTIMNGLINNSRRAAQRRIRLVEALTSEQQTLTQAEPDLADHFIQGRVPDALSHLPAVDQEVLSLLIDGYGVSEIATILGCSPGAVSMRLGRARTRLRTLLEQEDADA